MEAAVSKEEITPGMVRQLVSRIGDLEQRNQSLQNQLDWFKKQLFGQKSEKRLIEAPGQLDIAELLGEMPKRQDIPREKITYTRRKKQRGKDTVTDKGLRFDQDVPVEVIEIGYPEMRGADAGDYEVIGTKVSHKLAQRPGSFVVLEYRRTVVRNKRTRALSTPPMPAPVLDKCLADVSLLAGMLVDKFSYHRVL